MSRTRSLNRLLVACAIVAIGAVAGLAFLHAKGISFGLTRTYFTFGPVHAQDSMAGMQMAKPPAAPSTSLTVNLDGKSIVFSTAELKAMPQKTVKVHNEHTKADETYSGVLLSDVLAKAGFVADKSTQQKMLRSYLRVEGTDKYWVVYSLTEVEGSEHDGDVIVATGMNGGGLGADGELKLISTGDKKPQRWVRNLAGITMKSAE